jgi:phage terminase small subunit
MADAQRPPAEADTAAYHRGHLPRPDRHGERARPAPQPGADDLKDPPDWLPEGQRASWVYIVENARPGLLKKLDRGLVVAWCAMEEQLREAEIALADPKLPPGHAKLLRRCSDRAMRLMMALGDRLGFSPRARG